MDLSRFIGKPSNFRHLEAVETKVQLNSLYHPLEVPMSSDTPTTVVNNPLIHNRLQVSLHLFGFVESFTILAFNASPEASAAVQTAVTDLDGVLQGLGIKLPLNLVQLDLTDATS